MTTDSRQKSPERNRTAYTSAERSGVSEIQLSHSSTMGDNPTGTVWSRRSVQAPGPCAC